MDQGYAVYHYHCLTFVQIHSISPGVRISINLIQHSQNLPIMQHSYHLPSIPPFSSSFLTLFPACTIPGLILRLGSHLFHMNSNHRIYSHNGAICYILKPGGMERGWEGRWRGDERQGKEGWVTSKLRTKWYEQKRLTAWNKLSKLINLDQSWVWWELILYQAYSDMIQIGRIRRLRRVSLHISDCQLSQNNKKTQKQHWVHSIPIHVCILLNIRTFTSNELHEQLLMSICVENQMHITILMFATDW
jgi:hypothetical protein